MIIVRDSIQNLVNMSTTFQGAQSNAYAYLVGASHLNNNGAGLTQIITEFEYAIGSKFPDTQFTRP